MGREIKRVPLDFDWPLNKVWKGFVNPHYQHSHECGACAGTGASPGAKLLRDQWYGYVHFRPDMTGSKFFTPEHPSVRALAERNIKNSEGFYKSFLGATDQSELVYKEALRLCALWNASWGHHLDADDVQALIDADRLWDFTRNPRTPEQVEIVKKKMADGGNSWLPESNGYIPTPQEVNDWSIGGMGHDSINSWTVVSAKCKRLGIEETCAICQSSGSNWDSPADEKAADEWKESEPPTGDGWQLWETVSEGSPVSPVFATEEEFIAYLVGEGYSDHAAREFAKVGWVMSGMSVGGKFASNIAVFDLPNT